MDETSPPSAPMAFKAAAAETHKETAWALTESDPAVFTSLVSAFGVNGVQVDEVWDLEWSLSATEPSAAPVYGVIFLFKWDPSAQAAADTACVPWTAAPNVFFAKQVVQNACATQAILAVLLNCPNQLDLGADLLLLLDFCRDLRPDLKGHAISQCKKIKDAHNSFAQASPFDFEGCDKVDSKDCPGGPEKEDDFHFVAYVPVDGTVYMLDGLQSGPVPVATCPVGADGKPSARWTAELLPVLTSRLASFAESEIRFSVMALTADKRLEAEKSLEKVLAALGIEPSGSEKGVQLEQQRGELEGTILELRETRKDQEIEHCRRQHDMTPLVFTLLESLADCGQLQDLMDKNPLKKSQG